MEPGRLIMLKENVIYTQLMPVVDNLVNKKLIQTGYLDMYVLIVGQQREKLIAHVQLTKEQFSHVIPALAVLELFALLVPA